MIDKVATVNPRDGLPRFIVKLPLDSITTIIITQTSKLVYVTATVILEMLDYTIKKKTSTYAPMENKPGSLIKINAFWEIM